MATSNPASHHPSPTQTPRVQMVDISQTFGTTKVLTGVNLTVAAGEVHALVGQNGAGKSTLMKILGGLHPEHEGRILIDGEPVALNSPRAALQQGIGMIHQELSLIPSLSVADNILLGIEPGRGGYSRRATESVARSVTQRVPMLAELPLTVAAGELSTGFQQRIEIAKALAHDVRVLVMDEPTARLSGPERDDLRDLIRELSASGISIIYISHFLEETFQSCSALTILRNGRVVGTGTTAEYSQSSLTRAMLGAELAAEESRGMSIRSHDRSAEAVVELLGVSGPRISNIHLSLRRGRVVGLAGLVGSGRTRLARTITGAEPVLHGEMRLHGQPLRLRGPRDALLQGIVMVPENRKTEGLIGIASAQRNVILFALDRGLSRYGLVRGRRASIATREQFSELEIRPAAPLLAAERFSGGNQQKILLARAMLARPDALVIDQPTAGVDVGTKAQIHALIRSIAAAGTAVLLVTDDLDEMLSLADEITVMKSGRIVSVHERSDIDRPGLIDVMSDDEAAADR